MKRLLVPLALAAAGLPAAASDWRQFRGTDSTAVADEALTVQAVAADKGVAWKAELPDRGASSPVVAGGRVYLTASGGVRQDQLSVLAFDAKTGAKLWQRSFWATGPTNCHPKTCMAAPTPVSDGRHVVALFATGDLVALDAEGNVLWVRSLHEENPGATDGRGLASSPLLVGETVIVHMENQNTSFAAGVDLRTGANRWRVDRPKELCWTSPIALPGRQPGETLALLQGSTRLSAVDPMTGREVWKLDRPSAPIASSVLAGNVLYVPGSDEAGSKGLAALELQPDGPPKQLWQNAKLMAEFASPVVIGNRVYCESNGILSAADIKTGEVVGKLRLKGPFSATPVAAGGLLYFINEEGLVQVVRPDDKEGKVIHSGSLGETILATPAVADGALYVRSDRHLWKFAGG
jgi:outer membrane protein assembly factor BamB